MYFEDVRQLYNEGVFDRVLLPYRIIVKLLKLKANGRYKRHCFETSIQGILDANKALQDTAKSLIALLQKMKG